MLLQWSLILLFVSTYVLGQYTNTWAVEVHGGLQAADQLARKYGFENRGQVPFLIRVHCIIIARGRLRDSIQRPWPSSGLKLFSQWPISISETTDYGGKTVSF